MQVKFIKDATVRKEYDICCFSGKYSSNDVTFKPGDVVDIDCYFVDKKKIKIQPGISKVRKAEIHLNTHRLLNDRLMDVPIDTFELIKGS